MKCNGQMIGEFVVVGSGQGIAELVYDTGRVYFAIGANISCACIWLKPES